MAGSAIAPALDGLPEVKLRKVSVIPEPLIRLPGSILAPAEFGVDGTEGNFQGSRYLFCRSAALPKLLNPFSLFIGAPGVSRHCITSQHVAICVSNNEVASLFASYPLLFCFMFAILISAVGGATAEIYEGGI